MKWKDVPDTEDGHQAFLAYLDEQGAVNELSLAEDGELLIRFNFERLYEIGPEFAESVNKEALSEVQNTIDSLVERGLVLVSFEEIDNKLELVYGLTPDGEQALKSSFGGIEEDKWQSMLQEFTENK